MAWPFGQDAQPNTPGAFATPQAANAATSANDPNATPASAPAAAPASAPPPARPEELATSAAAQAASNRYANAEPTNQSPGAAKTNTAGVAARKASTDERDWRLNMEEHPNMEGVEGGHGEGHDHQSAYQWAQQGQDLNAQNAQTAKGRPRNSPDTVPQTTPQSDNPSAYDPTSDDFDPNAIPQPDRRSGRQGR